MPRRNPALSALGCLAVSVLLLFAPAAGAELYWHGNFETGDVSQWSALLNPQGIDVSGQHTAEGRYAGHVSIRGTPAYLWNGNPALNRVEFNYKPPPKRTAEGADVYFGWSFMLPALFANTRHEFGYWESEPHYQQMMRFNIAGSALSFQMTADKKPLWKNDKAIEPGHWHDLAMHIHWSTNARKGRVSVWFDGRRVVDNAACRTLPADSHAMFTQLGILRNAVDKVEEIYIDNAREASDAKSLLHTRAVPATGASHPSRRDNCADGLKCGPRVPD